METSELFGSLKEFSYDLFINSVGAMNAVMLEGDLYKSSTAQDILVLVPEGKQGHTYLEFKADDVVKIRDMSNPNSHKKFVRVFLNLNADIKKVVSSKVKIDGTCQEKAGISLTTIFDSAENGDTYKIATGCKN